jgi:hypothetical protein
MSLPACQQRVLDGMAEDLRASEPKLTAMFAIFTRLCGSDGRPLRERLADRPRLLRWSRAWCARLPGRGSARGRANWRRGLIAGHVAVFAALFAVLIVLSPNPVSTCGGAWLASRAAVSHQGPTACAAGMSAGVSRK